MFPGFQVSSSALPLDLSRDPLTLVSDPCDATRVVSYAGRVVLELNRHVSGFELIA